MISCWFKEMIIWLNKMCTVLILWTPCWFFSVTFTYHIWWYLMEEKAFSRYRECCAYVVQAGVTSWLRGWFFSCGCVWEAKKFCHKNLTCCKVLIRALGLDWLIDWFIDWLGQVAGSCEHGNKPSDSAKKKKKEGGVGLLDQLNYFLCHKIDLTTWSQLLHGPAATLLQRWNKRELCIAWKKMDSYKVWGSLSGAAEDSNLVGCYTLLTGKYVLMFWRIVVP